MNNVTLDPEPSDNSALFSALGWLGVIFVFIFILAVAYLPNRPLPIEEREAQLRYDILLNVRSEQAKLVNAYAWVNQAEGVVRIPVDRAMQLSIAELGARQLTADPDSPSE